MRSIPPGKVGILNPLAGFGITSPKQAKRYLRRGLAEPVGPNLIRMKERDPRREAARTSIALAARAAAATGYDLIARRLTLSEIRHIPVLCPERLRA